MLEKVKLYILVVKTVNARCGQQHDFLHLPKRIWAESENIT